MILSLQSSSDSPLPLLVLRVRADHAHDAAAPHDLALLADPLDRCSDLQSILSLSRSVPRVRSRGAQLQPHAIANQQAGSKFLTRPARRMRHDLSATVDLHRGTCAYGSDVPRSRSRHFSDASLRDVTLRPRRARGLATATGCGRPAAARCAPVGTPARQDQRPVLVTATVCSKCAERRRPSSPPSSRPRDLHRRRAHVHHRLDRQHHALGQPRPAAGLAVVGTCGSSCSAAPMPWPTNSRTTENPAPRRTPGRRGRCRRAGRRRFTMAIARSSASSRHRAACVTSSRPSPPAP